MKLSLSGIFLLLYCCIGCVHAEEALLNVYTWSGFLPEKVIRQFEQETGIRVNQATYANNEVLYAKLKANPEAGYDIVMPSSYFIKRMVKQGLLQKIDQSKLVNFSHLDPRFLNKEYDLHNDYSIPYLWSAAGIVVNRHYHSPQRLNAWRDLWHPRFKDQLLVLDDTREMFSMALLSLGYDINDRDPEHIKEAFYKLKSLMANIKLFNSEGQRAIYLDEDITIGMGWNGDLYLAALKNPNLTFIYPEEGFVILLDCIAIPAGAKHVQNAYRFINFVLQAEPAKQISLDSGFPSPNLAAQQRLPEAVRNNAVLYPDAVTMDRGQFQTDVGAQSRIYENYFERLKLEH